MTLTEFRNILDNKAITCEQFLRIHCCVEELFRRLLLIDLRLQKLQSKDAKTISESYYDGRHREFIKTLIELCGLEYKDLGTVRK